MTITTAWKAGGNNQYVTHAVRYGDYILNATFIGGYYGPWNASIGITKLSDASYRAFTYNAGYGQRGVICCVQDGDPWVVWGGTVGMRLDLDAATILEIITSPVLWTYNNYGGVMHCSHGGREWGFGTSTVTGWQYGATDVTISLPSAPTGWWQNHADSSDLWLYGTFGMRRLDLDAGTVVSSWADPFSPSPGFAPGTHKRFVVIGSNVYWVSNSGLIVWPLGGAPYLIPWPGGFTSFGSPFVTAAGMIAQVTSSNVQIVDPATAALVIESYDTHKPTNRTVLNVPVTVGTETWYPTVGTGTPTFP